MQEAEHTVFRLFFLRSSGFMQERSELRWKAGNSDIVNLRFRVDT
jgi:hypothetical protein